MKRSELKELRDTLSQSIAVGRGRYHLDDYIVMRRLLDRVDETGNITRNVVTGASHGMKTTEYTLCRNNGKLQIWEKCILKRETGEERQVTIVHTDARDILRIVQGYFGDFIE